MCILALPREYAFKRVLFLHYSIPAAEEAILFPMEFAVSLNASFRSERRERNVTLKCCIHISEHFCETRIGGSMCCTGFIEMESALTCFSLGYQNKYFDIFALNLAFRISRIFFPPCS